MIYIMILNVPITQISFMTIRIQKHLVEKFPIEISRNESIYNYISGKT